MSEKKFKARDKKTNDAVFVTEINDEYVIGHYKDKDFVFTLKHEVFIRNYREVNPSNNFDGFNQIRKKIEGPKKQTPKKFDILSALAKI